MYLNRLYISIILYCASSAFAINQDLPKLLDDGNWVCKNPFTAGLFIKTFFV